MKPVCPKCDRDIDSEDVNMAKGVLFCRRCNELFPIDSEPDNLDVSPDFDITDTPGGVELVEEFDGVTVKVKNRNWFAILFALFFGLMFGGVSILMLYKSVTGGMVEVNGVEKAAGLTEGLFSLPFLLVGIGAWCVVLFSLFGHTSVLISNTMCRAFTGIGSIGWKKEFRAEDIVAVELDCCGRTNNKPVHRLLLEMDNGSQLKFGTFIPESKVKYVRFAVMGLLNQLKK